MARIISVVNQKGGVGKTTTAINIAAFLAIKGKKTLLIDNDPQGNCSSGLGVKTGKNISTLYNVYSGEKTLSEIIQKTRVDGLGIVPSDLSLSGAELELIGEEEREFILKKAISEVEKDYDYILIDCPPSLTLLTVNALAASNSMLIPIQCEYFALEGLTQLLAAYDRIKKGINTDLEIEGVIMTMYDARTNLSISVVDEVKHHFKHHIFGTMIPRNVKLGEAPSFGLPIMLYDKKCQGCTAYEDVTDELIEGEYRRESKKKGFRKRS